MTTDARPRLEKRPPPRLNLTGPEWKLVVTGALGLAWAFTWLALAKPGEVASRPAEIAVAPAPPSGRASPRGATVASIQAPRRPAAAPARRPRSTAIRIRTRTS